MTASRRVRPASILLLALAFLASAGVAAVVSYFVASAVVEEDDAPSGPGIVSQAALYTPPAAGEGAAAAPVYIYTDEGPRIPFSESSGIADAGLSPARTPLPSSPPAREATAAVTSPTSTVATGTLPPVSTPTPTARPPAGGIGASAPVLPGRAGAAAIVPIDPCLLGSGMAGCPAGIFGRITGGPEPPPVPEIPGSTDGVELDLLRRLLGRLSVIDFLLGGTEPETTMPPEEGRAGEALTGATIVRAAALITAAEVAGAADVPGCVGPTATTASFVVGTTGPQYVIVYYWPAARASGEPTTAEARNFAMHTRTLVDRPSGGPRYESCATLDFLRVGITYEARVQTITDTGSAEWSPIGQFCLAPCLPTFRIPDATIPSHRLEVHAWGAYAILDSPPVGGALEFFVRAPGSSTWRISSLLSGYDAGEKVASPALSSGRDYEYRLVLHGNNGLTYESPPARFTTLRRKIFVQVSLFDVIKDGDDGDAGELTDVFLSTTTIGGECPPGESVCYTSRNYRDLAVPLDGLSGESPLNTGSIDVEAGTTIGVVPRADFVLDGHTQQTYLLMVSGRETDSPSVGAPVQWGHYMVHFRVPPGYGAPGSSALKSGEVCALPGASFAIRNAGVVVSGWYEGEGSGPWLQPSDAIACVVEFP